MNTSVRIQPFNFYALRDFSEPEDAHLKRQEALKVVEETLPPPPPPPPPPPTFSEADLERAKQQAFADGQAKGELDGMEKARSEDAERDSLLLSQLRSMSAQLESMRADHNRIIENHRAEAVQLGIHIAGLIAGRALKLEPTAVAESLVDACLEHLIEEPRMVLQAHPIIVDAIRQKTSKIAQDLRFEGTLNVEASPALSLTECRLSWANGEASLSPEAIWQDVLNRLLPEHIKALMPALNAIPGTEVDISAATTVPVEPVVTPAVQPTPPTLLSTEEVQPPSPISQADLDAYTPEYRIARSDENPIISDILHSIEEVIEATEKAEAEKTRKGTPPSENE